MLRFFAALAVLMAWSSAFADTVITHNGVSWTISGDDHKTGEFVTGDPWIVGPVRVVKITNSLNDKKFTPRDGQNGSMVNPLVGHNRQKQGYDDSLGSYDAKLNASRPNGKPVSGDNPLVLQPSSTLVSMVSWLFNSPDDFEKGCPRINRGMNAPRPATRSAGILTVLTEPAAEGSFRPPYAGGDKQVKFNVSMLDKSKLLKLEPVKSMPPLTTIEKYMARTWVDHVFEWLGGYVHPSEHMPNYGRDMARQTAIMALALQIDFDKLPGKPSKDKLLNRLVQYGIDCAGIADAGGGWRANGGHSLGRKWPILFAGVMLSDEHMSNVGFWDRTFGKGVEFQDDQQYFYVTEADVKLSHSKKWAPDKRNVKAGEALPYDKEHIGMAEWGIRHGYAPEQDNRHIKAKYRMINSGVMPAFVLAARLMGQQKAWNHDPLFDYSDRFMTEYDGGRKLTGGKAGHNTMDDFLLEMWHKYADKLPEITNYKHDKLGAFSFTCDDGFRHQVFNTLEILDPFGFKATFFIIPMYIAGSGVEGVKERDNVVTWDQVKKLHADGHEIGTHGSIAEPLHKATDERLDYLVNGSYDLIRQHAGITPVSYACPGGSKADSRVKEVIFQHHYVLRGKRGDIPEIRTMGYGNTDFRQWDDGETREKILERADDGLWSVAVIHAIVSGWSPFKSKDEFRAHCQWLYGQQDKIWVAPIGEVGMYLKARKATEAKLISVGEKSVKLELDCSSEMPEMFKDVELTVKMPVKNAASVSAADCQGRQIAAQFTPDEILVDFSVNCGTVEVKWQ